MAILTDAEMKQVATAVQAAESNTAGELVVLVTARSGDYALPRAALAACLTVALALEGAALFADSPVWWFLLGQLPVGVGLYWLLGAGKLLRWVVPAKLLAATVERNAMQAFLDAGVTETRDRSGILIYLSEAEHRAVILGDTGIHQRVAAGQWQQYVDVLVKAIASKQAAQGLLEIIEQIGAVLASTFPPRLDDENELPDDVRVV